MLRSDVDRIIYAIFSAMCIIIAAILVAAGHIASADILRGQHFGISGPELYFINNMYVFAAAGFLLILGFVLGLKTLRPSTEHGGT